MKRVVVAVDGSEVSRALMGYAFHYAYREGDTELYFLHVVETTKYAGFEPGPLWTGAYLPCDEDRMNQARRRSRPVCRKRGNRFRTRSRTCP